MENDKKFNMERYILAIPVIGGVLMVLAWQLSYANSGFYQNLLIVAVLLVIAAALVDGGVNGGHESGVRHGLPAPYVPQCYAIIEWGGGFCQFRL